MPDLQRTSRDEVLAYCNALPGAVEDHPFGDGVAVFKVDHSYELGVAGLTKKARASLELDGRTGIEPRGAS